MDEIASQTFGAVRIDVGGKHFDRCKFSGTTLVYSGGKCPRFTGNCEFDGAKFDFTGEGWEAFAWIRTLRVITTPDFIEALLGIGIAKSGDGTSH